MASSITNFMTDLHDRSDAYADQFSIPAGGVDDARDAFRHALSSAIISRDYGSGVAEQLGTLFEIISIIDRGRGEEPSSRMDVGITVLAGIFRIH